MHTQEWNSPLLWMQWYLHFSLQLPCLVLCFKWVHWSQRKSSNFGRYSLSNVWTYKDGTRACMLALAGLVLLCVSFHFLVLFFGFSVLNYFQQAMTMMGLYDSAYWLSWLTWEGILTILSSLLTVLFGMLFRFDIFLKNSFAVVFLLFFLFQINMVDRKSVV